LASLFVVRGMTRLHEETRHTFDSALRSLPIKGR